MNFLPTMVRSKNEFKNLRRIHLKNHSFYTTISVALQDWFSLHPDPKYYYFKAESRRQYGRTPLTKNPRAKPKPGDQTISI